MTPKEKANQLVNRMLNCTEINHPKLAALIAVDEILEIEKRNLIIGDYNEYDYWKEVNKEIENL